MTLSPEARKEISYRAHMTRKTRGTAVLCDDDVIFIRTATTKGIPVEVLAKYLNRDKTGLYKVANGTTYKHVPFKKEASLDAVFED